MSTGNQGRSSAIHQDRSRVLEQGGSPVPNQDRPSTWIPYRPTNCQKCRAVCCKLPLEVRAADLVRLGLASVDEAGAPRRLGKRLVREGVVRSFRAATGFFLLEQKSNGDCRFLGEDRRCTVYEQRPDTCRDFPSLVGPRVGFCPYRPAAPGTGVYSSRPVA